jgi:hypothetical protein
MIEGINITVADDESGHNRTSIEDVKILINIDDRSSLKDKRIKETFTFLNEDLNMNL